MSPSVLPPRITGLDMARQHVASFACPDGFSTFAWKQLRQTAISVWHAHLNGSTFRGSLHFCRPEFYDMLRHPDGSTIIPEGRIRGYQAA